LYNKNKTSLIQYPAGKKDSSFIIPNSVTGIGNYAFSQCKNLTGITIPASVTSIEGYAFYRCSKLASVIFEGNISEANFSNNSFDGDLRTKYLAGGIGTYTRANGTNTWTKK
jgi:hypothetical protein